MMNRPPVAADHDNLRREFLDVLGRQRSGMTALHLRQLLGLRSVNQTLEVLEKLRADGLAEPDSGGRWRAINPQFRSPSVVRHPSVGSVSFNSQLPKQDEFRQEPRQTFTGPSRWDSFRRLCRYYAECARLEEQPSLVSNLDKEGEEFAWINQAIDWQRLAAGDPIHLTLDDVRMEFVQSLRRRRRGSRLFLGTPVDVRRVRKDRESVDCRLVCPVFVVQIEYELQRVCLVLHPLLPVDINHGWLERRFYRQSDAQQEFLEHLGLRHDDRELKSSSLTATTVTSLHHSYSILESRYRAWWCETPNLSRPNVDPRLRSVKKAGLCNRIMLIAQPQLRYCRGLINDLKEIATVATDEELDQTALRWLFPHDATAGRKLQEGTKHGAVQGGSLNLQAAEYSLLNDEQRSAVTHAGAAALTIVTGPPGTGKSVVVGHTMANAAIQGRTVLFASRNHQAIEAVVPRVNGLVEEGGLVIRASRPFGDSGAQHSWVKTITDLLIRPIHSGARTEYEDTRRALQSALEDRARWESRIRNINDAANQLAQATEDLRKRLLGFSPAVAKVIREVPQLAPTSDYEVTAQVLNPSPVNVNALHRVYRAFVRRLRLKGMINKAATLDSEASGIFGMAPCPATGTKDEYAARLTTAMSTWTAVANAIESARRCGSEEARIRTMGDQEVIAAELQRAQRDVELQTTKALHSLTQVAGSGLKQEEIATFSSIRAALLNSGDTVNPDRLSQSLVNALHNNLQSLIHHYPLWAVANLSAHSSLPLSAGCFDLLIIDEASQCDIASVIPLLYRARRAMVVGDPMQLEPVFQLSRQADSQLRQRLGLADDLQWGRYIHRVNSFYMLASSCPQLDRERDVIQLRSHFRCHPAIAEYCNESFYRKTLRVRTNTSQLRSPTLHGTPVHGCSWTHVTGEIQSATQGCFCPAQIDAVLHELRRLQETGFEGTIGVVTPFRVQANRINDRARQELPKALLDLWQFHVDTADGFQGDERDVIFFSLVGGPDMPEGSTWFYSSNRNRFNVAASRARALLHVIGDVSWAADCGISHIQGLLRACRPSTSKATLRNDLIGPVWEPLVADAMRKAGIDFEQQYPACGFFLDFALFRPHIKVNIEVDGETWHRDERGRRRIEDDYRDVILSAAGWRVLRFWVYELRENMETCLERIRRAIHSS